MEDLKFLGKCPFCGKKYNKKKIEIIERYEHLSVVYVQCSSCKSASILAITIGSFGMVTTVGVLSDFQIEDLKKFINQTPISADDVLEIHKTLRNSI